MKRYKINYTENCIDVEYKGKSMCWTMSELQEDTEAILAVINAVKLACEGKLDKLTGAWRKGNPHEDTRRCHLCGGIEENKWCVNTTCSEYTKHEK